MDRYIGLDVHATSTTAAIVGSRGKKLGSTVLEINGRVLVQHVKGLSGTVHVCLEEGAQAGWIYEILSPHVAEVVVVRVKRSKGPKSDKLDAFGLAEMLRRGAVVVRVFKDEGQYGALRQLVKVHLGAVQDTVRAQNRLKGIFRSRGVPVAGKSVYGLEGRDEWLAKLPGKSRTGAEGDGVGVDDKIHGLIHLELWGLPPCFVSLRRAPKPVETLCRQGSHRLAVAIEVRKKQAHLE